ncbi:hypothetical protein [Stenotrophomonas maltophilia]|uniref:hypothetical protein n=1 Tax=Stenotrophomonas maltophilia TaxID=40324 RepID=UPI0011B56985|nr:hypothetical protein [Stenotrophomonas maltophilia]
MNEITHQSRKISVEMLVVDCKTPGRLVEHYERCSPAQRKDYLAALAMALCVSEQRRRLTVAPDLGVAKNDALQPASEGSP